MPGLILEPDDVCVYVTEKCNSNCVMCPMSVHARQRGLSIDDHVWDSMLDEVPEDTRHMTITGGEPFLEYRHLLPIMRGINERFSQTDILVLTNGRVFAIPEVREALRPLITEKYCFAIPVHGMSAASHDTITQTIGSFHQTMQGLRFLGETPGKVEIRIVGHRINSGELASVFQMIADSDLRVDVIHLIAMEMTGSAAANREKIWMDYRELCSRAEPGIQYAMMHGIDVGLYT